jgi:hypothetical protein
MFSGMRTLSEPGRAGLEADRAFNATSTLADEPLPPSSHVTGAIASPSPAPRNDKIAGRGLAREPPETPAIPGDSERAN